MHYGSQEDVPFLQSFINANHHFDVIIDDGGHTMKQQLTSIVTLLPMVSSGGLYIIEDLETSFPAMSTANCANSSTTLDFIKDLVGDIHKKAPRRKTPIADRVSSFEIANNICFFMIK